MDIAYEDEKEAKLLASHLNSPAFEVYMRLSDAEKKQPRIIKEELRKEFEKAELNREEALHQLNNRRLQQTESVSTFSYKVSELVRLAYKDFNEVTRSTITKDYFVKALSQEMQITLKSMESYKDKSLKDLVTETTRL